MVGGGRLVAGKGVGWLKEGAGWLKEGERWLGKWGRFVGGRRPVCGRGDGCGCGRGEDWLGEGGKVAWLREERYSWLMEEGDGWLGEVGMVDWGK